MGREIDDDVKQKLLDSLAKEPPMVLSTAYAYAKNYVRYGEDITKAWTTAAQQASIIEKVSLNARAEAYDSFKKDYENRLKADMVAMLEELKSEFEEKIQEYEARSKEHINATYEASMCGRMLGYCGANEIIQEKIDLLKGENDV